jgi:protein-disulfide isomerase
MKRFAALTLLLFTACSSTGSPVVLSSRGPHPASNPDAPVVVVEYADFQCPSCRAAHTNIVGPLLEQYGTSIRYEFRHFPLRSMHPQALAAAEAAECAADQGKFWEYADLAFSRQRELSGDQLLAWAAEISLETSRFEPCLASESKRSLVLSEFEEGRKRGVLGTPTFFVNGKKVESKLGAIQKAIEAAQGSAG